MRRKTPACGVGPRYWLLAVALAAGMVAVGAASAAPGNKEKPTKEAAGKQDPRKDTAGKDTTKPQRVELVIQVSDGAGNPVRGAAVIVVIDNLEIEQRSDTKGRARFGDLPVGSARVQAVATGWNTSGRNIALDRERVQVDLALTPRKPPAGGTAAAHGGEPGSSRHPAGKGGGGAGAVPSSGEQPPGRVQTAADDDVPEHQTSQPRPPEEETPTSRQGTGAGTAP